MLLKQNFYAVLLCSPFNYEGELYGGEAENASPPSLVQNKIIGTLAKVQISPYSFVKFKQRDCETGKKEGTHSVTRNPKQF